MSFGDRVRNFFREEQKASAAASVIVGPAAGREAPKKRDRAQLAEEGYKQNVVIYKAVDVIARSVSDVPMVLKQQDQRGNVMDVDSHPVLDLLQRPNPQQTGTELVDALMRFLLITGNSYVESVGDAVPSELWTKRPDRMSIIQGGQGLPQAFKLKAGGGDGVTWPVDQVTGDSQILHVKFFHPLDDWYGMSPIEAAAWETDISNKGRSWTKALLDNSARPSGILSTDRVLEKNQVDSVQQQIEQLYSGDRNAGRAMVMQAGLKWNQTSLSPRDMEFRQELEWSSRLIAQAFGMPGLLLGLPGDNTFSNYKEARQHFTEETVLPLARRLANEFTNWLLPKFENTEGMFFDLDLEKVDGLESKRQTRWERVESATFLTINEKRETVGLEPIEGGDVLFVEASKLPLRSASADDGSGDTGGEDTATDAEKRAILAYGVGNAAES